MSIHIVRIKTLRAPLLSKAAVSFMIVFCTEFVSFLESKHPNLNNQVEEDEMGGPCSTNGGEEERS
jgi:hypothetical protein